MPTSVLLAVLAAAGLLALAPALVRRYDATERLVAERAQSTARVLQRRRRRRTVPGRRPVNPPRPLVVTPRLTCRRRALAAPVSAPPAAGRARPARLRAVPRRPRAGRRRRPPRRAGTPRPSTGAAGCSPRCCCSTSSSWSAWSLVSPGFWISFSVTGTAARRLRRPPAATGRSPSAGAGGGGPGGGLAGRPAGRGPPGAGPPGRRPPGGAAPAGRPARGGTPHGDGPGPAGGPAAARGGPAARSPTAAAGGLRGRPVPGRPRLPPA